MDGASRVLGVGARFSVDVGPEGVYNDDREVRAEIPDVAGEAEEGPISHRARLSAGFEDAGLHPGGSEDTDGCDVE